MSTLSVDLAVVGAGPAGSAAAIEAAALGLKVAMIEHMPFPRFRPGECLHPGLEVILARLGVLAQVLSHAAVRPLGRSVYIGSTSAFDAFGCDASGAWRAIHIERAHLDEILLRRAIDLGVTTRTIRAQPRLIIADGEPCGIEVDEESIRCAYVIDATGQSSWLTRAFGLQSLRLSPRLTAFYGYCNGNVDEEQCFRAEAAGWTWVAQVTPMLVNWICLRFGQHRRVSSPACVSTLQANGRSRGADVTWRMAPRLAGKSFFLVGDAACVLDPASGNGVLRALMSGVKAAHNSAAVLEGKTLALAAAHEYRAWLTQWFHADARRLRAMYDALRVEWGAPSQAGSSRGQSPAAGWSHSNIMYKDRNEPDEEPGPDRHGRLTAFNTTRRQ